ncbi:holliday-junction resolvase/ endonuclease [Xanthomonas phage XAP3]|nr:holliday-junction resolvase/ endonuclease [Xanthomonas phage XAP3]
MEQLVRESKVEKRCCEYATGRGWWVSKFTAPGKKAVPDRLFIRNGVVLFVEFKRPGKEPTVQQAHRHKQMRENGANVTWTDNFEDFKNYIISFE